MWVGTNCSSNHYYYYCCFVNVFSSPRNGVQLAWRSYFLLPWWSWGCGGGDGHWARSLSVFPTDKSLTWDTAPLSTWEPRDLAHSTAENCPGKVGVGGMRGVVKPSDLDQLAVTVRSKGWSYLKTPPNANNKCEAKINFSKLWLILF